MIWMFAVLLFLILVVVSCLIYSVSLNPGIKKAMEYESLGIEMFNSLKMNQPDIGAAKAKAIINEAVDEKWFLSLNKKQRDEFKKYVSQYLIIHQGITQKELVNHVTEVKEKLYLNS